jgi:carboxymethylenebutenolidase
MNHLQRYLAEEFAEDYVEGRLTRRQALKLIASITGSLALASSFLAACAPEAPPAETLPPAPTNPPAATSAPAPTQASAATEPPTEAASTPAPAEATPTAATDATAAVPIGTVPADDPSLQAGPVEFTGEDGATVMGYLARPLGDGPFPVVLVCHENRGLTAHIEDVTRRVAKAGYVGLAVDLLSRQGGSAAVGADNAPGALSQRTPEQHVADFRSGLTYLGTQSFADTARAGMVGFCFGGGVTWQAAVQMPELKAAVPFYGPPPLADQVPSIQAAVLAIYGGQDTRITSTLPTIQAAMDANGKTFEPVVYDGADHAFHNDTGGRYNSQAAQDAWIRTISWFEEYL